jgi:hypothetical protein
MNALCPSSQGRWFEVVMVTDGALHGSEAVTMGEVGRGSSGVWVMKE